MVREIEDIWTISKESRKEEEKNDVPTLIIMDTGELLMKSNSQVNKAPFEDSQKDQILHFRYKIGGKAYDLIIDNDSYTNVASKTR